MIILRYTCYLLASLLLAGCSSSGPDAAAADEVEVKTPVTVTTVSNAPIKETLDLNAVSLYQKKNTVKAGTAGYIQKVYVRLGEHVTAGASLFSYKTKEAQVLGDLMTQDPSLHFNGIKYWDKFSLNNKVVEINKEVFAYRRQS